MQIEIKGKIVSVLPEQKFNGKNGEVVKNTFVVEWLDNGYKVNLCLEVVGADKFEKMRSNIVVGNDVMCRFSVSSREWNGRWFTTASCFYCVNVNGNSSQNASNAGGGSDNNQGQAPSQQQQGGENKSDELPF